MISYYLQNELVTLALGRALAETLPAIQPYPVLLLTGCLGTGKTTLVRGIVTALPGSDTAEVASPSFTLYHLYPTQPEVAHFDLYRLENRNLDIELLEALDNSTSYIVIEWANFLPNSHLPANRLLLHLIITNLGRTATLTAIGSTAAWQLYRINFNFRRQAALIEADSPSKKLDISI